MWHSWSMGWMGLWGLLLLAAVVLVAVWVVRSGASSPPVRESPEEVVKRRYAAGEIDREEYQRRLDDLRK